MDVEGERITAMVEEYMCPFLELVQVDIEYLSTPVEVSKYLLILPTPLELGMSYTQRNELRVCIELAERIFVYARHGLVESMILPNSLAILRLPFRC
jgi:hypothetical protein